MDGKSLCAVLVGESGQNEGNSVVTMVRNAGASSVVTMLAGVPRRLHGRIGRVALSVTKDVRGVTGAYFPHTVRIVSEFRMRGLMCRTMRRLHVACE